MRKTKPSQNLPSLSVGLLGPEGRMGQWVCRLMKSEFAQHKLIPVGRGEALAPLYDTDVIIDFSAAQAAAELAQKLLKLGGKTEVPGLVIGSTGWTQKQASVLKPLAQKTAILQASNFSEGLYLVSRILHEAGPALRKFGYQPVIREIHHVHKKDSPSGTALTLQKIVTARTGLPTDVQSIRAGEVIGDHEVLFFSKADRITLSHSAQDRSIFARGAIRAALWLAENRKKPKGRTGFFGMADYYDSILEKNG